MERTVVTINAKNKGEAVVCLEMALEAMKDRPDDSAIIDERVCITNEGKRNLGSEHGLCKNNDGKGEWRA